MSLSVGTRVGPYEVLSALGAGGMGEVYRARDTKLGRDVAIKVLPELFASDPERLARFQREAQVLASLNHPNIAQIHGLEESAGVRALVMELVDGEDLAQRIGRGPIPLDDALPIARQIAEALDAAHQHGIVHRDLKPANIKLRPDGTVKVLDFGLAKALDGPASVADLSQSPTVPVQGTRAGVILGTAAYMSPEQARGRPLDKRTDIWAFGCVSYEMLTGRPAFAGDTLSDTIAAILGREPDWKALPGSTPQRLRDLLRRCLHKDPKRRLHDIADAGIEIDEVQSSPHTDALVRSVPRRKERLAWMSVLALVALVAVVLGVFAFRSAPSPPEMRLDITTPPTTDPFSMAISPDGQRVVFVATAQGRSQLWVRSLDSVSARPLAGTDGAYSPFWSADSRSVGFFAVGGLKRIDIAGGSAQVLAHVALGLGGTWNRDGVILFCPAPGGPLFHIPATGGEPAALTRLEPQQTSHLYPTFLPDGRHFLYYVGGSPGASGVYVGQLDGSQTRRLFDADAPAVASAGHLLFVRQGTLLAQGFDPVRSELTGNPFPVAERVLAPTFGLPVAAVSASVAGPLVYRSGSMGLQQFVWFDRSGKEIGKVSGPDIVGAIGPSLSRDGRRVALFRGVNGNVDVWLLEIGRNVVSRFTSDAADDCCPIWSPDGTHIVFTSNRKGVFNLYQKPAAGAEREQLLLTSAQPTSPTDWSPDGRFLLYDSVDPQRGADIWALPLDGDRKPVPVVQTNFNEGGGQFSPNGKWIAYQSNESGRLEIYLQAFPGPRGRSLISITGGAQVRWRPDGKELFYISLDSRLMAVPIQFSSNSQAVEAGAPVPLFAMGLIGPVDADLWYMVASNGQRFLLNTLTDEPTPPITVILNWRRDGAR